MRFDLKASPVLKYSNFWAAKPQKKTQPKYGLRFSVARWSSTRRRDNSKILNFHRFAALHQAKKTHCEIFNHNDISFAVFWATIVVSYPFPTRVFTYPKRVFYCFLTLETRFFKISQPRLFRKSYETRSIQR